MKRTHLPWIVLCLCLLCGTLGLSAFAEENASSSATLYISLSDGSGNLAVAGEKITVTDADRDGKLTVSDALYALHEAKYPGGARVGYAFETTAYGRSLKTLWGVSNGGAYGYYLNHMLSDGLLQEVSDGDLLDAFVYTDVHGLSDQYCFFAEPFVSVDGGKELTLTLIGTGMDRNWDPVTYPIAGATVLINGRETSYVTDANGKVTIKFDGNGSCTVSAKKDGANLVPPACTVTVTARKPFAGDDLAVLFWVSVAGGSLIALHCIRKKRFAPRNS